MKLWLLRPVELLPDDNPWEPPLDRAFGFVVRAKTEEQARLIANVSGGDETGPTRYNAFRKGGDPWLDPALSTCVELRPEGTPGVIVRDYCQG